MGSSVAQLLSMSIRGLGVGAGVMAYLGSQPLSPDLLARWAAGSHSEVASWGRTKRELNVEVPDAHVFPAVISQASGIRVFYISHWKNHPGLGRGHSCHRASSSSTTTWDHSREPTWWKKRTDCWMLSSVHASVRLHMRTHIQILTR